MSERRVQGQAWLGRVAKSQTLRSKMPPRERMGGTGVHLRRSKAPDIMNTTYTLVISCPDQRGIVAAVSSFIAAHQGSIIEADYHTDRELNWFFMRQEILAESL